MEINMKKQIYPTKMFEYAVSISSMYWKDYRFYRFHTLNELTEFLSKYSSKEIKQSIICKIIPFTFNSAKIKPII
jgi:hypothetical protein